MSRIHSLFILIIIGLCAHAQEKYIMHSSKLVLGCSSDDRAIIVSPNDSRAKKLELKQRNDGTWNISCTTTTGTKLYLTKIGSWDAFFCSDKEMLEALWEIEEVGNMIKLRNVANDKYLGTDGTENGNYVFSDKSGTDEKHKWYLADRSTDAPKADTLTYMVNPSIRRQPIEGWGVSLCWWANMCGKWSDSQIDKLVTWLVSPSGLNYNIFRYNIGGGDDPKNTHCTLHHMGNGKGLRAEMEGFQDERGGEFIWSRDEAQRKIMLKIKEKRPDAIFEAFSNSAPWWMTYSGCCAGNTNAGKDNLRTDYYKDFANYLVEVCKHYKEEYGIEFRTLEPFNEPMTSYWGANGGQEGCHFDVESQIAFIKVLAPILKASGLNTVISASDETSVYNGFEAIQAYQMAGILDHIGQWNTHTYSADDKTRCQVGSIARSNGMRQWMSEVGSGGEGILGNLNLAQKLMDDIRYMAPDAWIDWQYVEEYGDQWCLVNASFSNPSSATRVKSYYVRQHFSKFIPAGYRFVSSLNRNTLCALSPDEKELVLVVINASTSKAYHKASLRFCEPATDKTKGYYTTESSNVVTFRNFNYDEDGDLLITLPAKSIVTMVIPVENVACLAANQVPKKAILVPQSNHALAMTATTTKVSAETNRYADSQLWNITDNGDGTYGLTTEEGLKLTRLSSSYPMVAKTLKTGTQAFGLQNVDGYHYTIQVKGLSKYLDLQGASTEAGTTIGHYAYPDASSINQHWMIVGLDGIEESEEGVQQTLEAHHNLPIYDLQGRKLTQKPQRGIYIQGGKTMLVR